MIIVILHIVQINQKINQKSLILNTVFQCKISYLLLDDID